MLHTNVQIKRIPHYHVHGYHKEKKSPGPCLVQPKNQNLFKIPRHIESYATYMEY